MQHLKEDHEIREPKVHHATRKQIRPPSNVESFHRFPRQKGWYINHDDHKICPLPEPLRSGIPIEQCEPNLRRFVQAWLFFGLIFTIVQEDKRPLMDYEDLLEKHDKNFVSTKKLRRNMERWAEWEKAEWEKAELEKSHPKGQRLRLIRVEEILRLARRVVRSNFAWGDRPVTETPPLLRDDPLYVDDETVLSLMTLGESLQDAKSKIDQITGMRMRGWDNEDDSGWGPPKYVMKKMEGSMCPRTVHLLRGQLRSSATLLLSAWNTMSASSFDPDDSMARARHKDMGCTSSICKVNPQDEPGKYNQRHCTIFCMDNGQPRSCLDFPESIIKKNILDILEKGGRPLLKFTGSNDGHSNAFNLEVVSWKAPMKYTTISHVWSDGFGNPKANTMLECQLRFIRHQLIKLEWGEDAETPWALSTPSLPFWMDTLLIPVGDDRKIKDLKSKSIQQIPQTFRDSTYTIVLDFGLTNADPSDNSPAQTAMKIIASSWMRRLWTLQEAFLSQNLYVAFSHHRKTLKHFDSLCRELEHKENGFTSTLITKVKHQLQSHVMDEGRTMRNTAEARSPRQAAVLVVNAWKAARWRVSHFIFSSRLPAWPLDKHQAC